MALVTYNEHFMENVLCRKMLLLLKYSPQNFEIYYIDEPSTTRYELKVLAWGYFQQM